MPTPFPPRVRRAVIITLVLFAIVAVVGVALLLFLQPPPAFNELAVLRVLDREGTQDAENASSRSIEGS